MPTTSHSLTTRRTNSRASADVPTLPPRGAVSSRDGPEESRHSGRPHAGTTSRQGGKTGAVGTPALPPRGLAVVGAAIPAGVADNVLDCYYRGVSMEAPERQLRSRCNRPASGEGRNGTMDAQGLQLPHHHQVVLDRFVAACQADERVVAAFLGGSYASGTADAYSDLDLGLITTDAAYDEFVAGREAFIRRLGEPV